MSEINVGMRNKRSSNKNRPKKFDLVDNPSEAVRVGRTTSLMWDAENDPFQVFEVEHEDCWDLQIDVKNGENITKGFYKDLIDVPDPYVVLRVPGSSNSSKRTSHVDNNVNPIWNESFHFYLDPKKEHTLHVILMDANHFQDETLGEECLDIASLVPNVVSHFTMEFPGGSKVYITLTLQKNKNPDLRFSLSLCEEEKAFLRLRRLNALKKMQKLLGPDRAPKHKNEVPVIAVLGSGGGFRAMTCFSAAVKALHQSGIMGCSCYVSGLSGSSWFISTLYANEKFPNITYDEIYEDLKVSVTQNWKWNLMHCHKYFIDMMRKSRCGQPVSFTDIFGHLLGDVLLKGMKDKKLSDQRQILKEGEVPLPLYTCLHAKASVSCRSFSEWIEFSPYEIGIAKYGTFMKTEYFGSKFIVGKLIKQFPEFPLHYLQGVWGSAFTILMKRLAFDGGSKQDIVQMMRDVNEERAISEKLEDEYFGNDGESDIIEKESDTDDESDIEGADDKSSGEESDEKPKDTLEQDIAEINELIKNTAPAKAEVTLLSRTPLKEENEEESNRNPVIENQQSLDNGSNTLPRKNSNFEKKMKKGFSFDFVKKGSYDLHRKQSQEEANDRKFSTQSDPGTILSQKTNMDIRSDRLQRNNAFKERKNLPSMRSGSNYWSEKRSKRKSQKERKPSIIQNWMKTSGFLNSRAGRAGEVLNPFRGLSLRNSFPISPFANAEDDEDDNEPPDSIAIGLGCRYKPLDNTAKKLFIVDSGLAFNSPYPLLLRPQRAVDMYLSFDFSQRPSDRHMPFKELLLAEKWAQQNQVPFPPVEKLAREFSLDPEVKELYIFKDAADPFCPVILHFTIVNNRFKWNKAPGVPRKTDEEIDFANFSLFDDPSQPYASTNFVYEPLQFERLFKLIEYNTLINIETIKDEIAELVTKKRKMMAKSAEQTFTKMQKVVDACKKFQRSGNLSLKVNESQRKQFILACKAAGVSSSSTPSSAGDNSTFFDALEDVSEDEDSVYEELGDDTSDISNSLDHPKLPETSNQKENINDSKSSEAEKSHEGTLHSNQTSMHDEDNIKMVQTVTAVI